VIDPITRARVTTVVASGFQNEVELADEVLKFVSRVGKELLDSGSLNDEQTRGVRAALNDTPIAFAYFRASLTCFPLSDEQKANLVFMLGKVIDDMLSLGATAVAAGSETIASSVIKGGTDGGLKSAEVRQKKQKNWEDRVLAEAGELLKKNGRLTQDDITTKLQERRLPGLPGRTRIITFLSQAQRDGRLPKRTQ
jgi:hypothetical protein